MPLVRVTDYRVIPFSEETPCGGYKFANVSEVKDLCGPFREDTVKVHCIGVIYSECGTFYVKDLPGKSAAECEDVVVSVTYLPTPPLSTIPPYTARLYGEVLWRGRPVIIAHILQHIHPTTAAKLHDSMNRIKRRHAAVCI